MLAKDMLDVLVLNRSARIFAPLGAVPAPDSGVAAGPQVGVAGAPDLVEKLVGSKSCGHRHPGRAVPSRRKRSAHPNEAVASHDRVATAQHKQPACIDVGKARPAGQRGPLRPIPARDTRRSTTVRQRVEVVWARALDGGKRQRAKRIGRWRKRTTRGALDGATVADIPDVFGARSPDIGQALDRAERVVLTPAIG